MQSEPNKPELKLAIARFLGGNKIVIAHETESTPRFFWGVDMPRSDEKVHEAEWLYVVHLVEQTLSRKELWEYVEWISQIDDVPAIATANFNQRATALCKVKGVAV